MHRALTARTVPAGQLRRGDGYLLSPHRHPRVRIGQQVRRPCRMMRLPEVAAHQEQSIAFAQVHQRYPTSLSGLSAGRGQQEKRHPERTEYCESAVASAQKSEVQRSQFADAPGTQSGTDDGGHRPPQEWTRIATPTHFRKSLFAHATDNSTNSTAAGAGLQHFLPRPISSVTATAQLHRR